MRKPFTWLLALLALLVAAVLLNPSAERHRTHIRDAMAERSPLAGLLGLGALTAFVSNYHSLGVASYTSVHGHVLSVGCLGVVDVLDPQQDP
jgi:hypothetical protein